MKYSYGGCGLAQVTPLLSLNRVANDGQLTLFQKAVVPLVLTGRGENRRFLGKSNGSYHGGACRLHAERF